MKENDDFVPLSEREKFEQNAKLIREQKEIASINLESARTQLEICKISATSKRIEFNRFSEIKIFLYVLIGLSLFNLSIIFFKF